MEQNREQQQTPSPSSNPQSEKPPPVVFDSGVKAWLQVVAAWCLYFNTWGLISAYGSFQNYYETVLLKDKPSKESSIVGSLQVFLLVALGFFAGPLCDAGYQRHIIAVGSVFIVVGTICQSFCTVFWQLLLAQGACIGIGCGCLSLLSVAIPQAWFRKRLLLANGIATSGSAIGGIIIPLIVRYALPKVGFGWTVRIVALILGILLAVANVVFCPPHASKQRRVLIDIPSLTDWPYVLYAVGSCFVYFGLYTPFFFVEPFAIKTHIASPNQASYIVMAMNVTGVFGRLLPGLLTKRLDPLIQIIAITMALGVMALGLLGAKSVGSVYVVAAFYGGFTGAFFAVLPTNVVGLTSNMKVIGTRFGMAFGIMSFFVLFGTPIAGALQDSYGSNASWWWTFANMFVAVILYIFTKVSRMRRT